MILISAQELSKSYTSRPLFEGLTFSIESGERIGLIGPNGAGKSTLLKILAGKSEPDAGKLSISRDLKIGFMEQVPQFKEDSTILSAIMEKVFDPDDWEVLIKANELISKLDLAQFGEDKKISELSGGWKKRVALGREIILEPNLLLLDEPTNHLDIESIIWLEEFLAKSNFATVTVTHDRVFLQKVSNRIIEIDKRHPKGLLSVKGDYVTYLELREELLAAQEQHEVKLKNTLRRETEWLRRGAKARQTKQHARIEAAHDLKDQVSELSERNQNKKVRFDFLSLEKNPKKLIEAKGILKSYEKELIIPKLDLLIGPKSRIALMGKNGTGKSTLIKILTKNIVPDEGEVFHSEKLKIVYFEQNRESLNPNHTILQIISPYGDYVDFGGLKVHVKSYLTRFLFRYDQMETEVRKLSGGEQSRLLLAKIMLNESNVLILDEPTNDLDLATLDVLAQVIEDYQGAVILVSHDRYFLDQVTNQILAFGVDELGNKKIFSMSGLEQWEIWRDEQTQLMESIKNTNEKDKKRDQLISPATNINLAPALKKKKLSFKEQRELNGMEENIKNHEEKLENLKSMLTSQEFAKDSQKTSKTIQDIAILEENIEKLYQRWSDLSGE